MGKEFENVVAMAPKKQIKTMYLTNTNTGGQQWIVKSTPGTIAKVIGLTCWFIKPTGGTTGATIIEIGYKSNAGGGTFIDNSIINVSAPYNADNKITRCMVDLGGVTANSIAPNNDVAFGQAIQSLMFGATDPQALRFDLRDTTNGTTSNKYLWLTYLEEEIR